MNELAEDKHRLLIRDPEIATFIHAASGQKFSAHVKLLCHYSPFFARALNGPFQESTSKSVEIHDTDEWVLETFHHWLYFHEVKWTPNNWVERVEQKGEKWVDWTQCELVKLCCFADQYDVPELLKAALRDLCDALNDDIGVDAEALLFAQDHLVDSSPVTCMLVDGIVRFGLLCDDGKEEEEEAAFMNSLKPAFAACVVKRVLEGRNKIRRKNDGAASATKIDIDTFLAAVDTAKGNKNKPEDQAMAGA
ncbi:hypothetical protein MBLNU457_g0468t1 [Dothideomycetes sp. NU457]